MLVRSPLARRRRCAPARRSGRAAQTAGARYAGAAAGRRRPPTGRITGRVLAADTGRPVKRARVFVNAAELPGGRGVLTDDDGVFEFTELPAGRYTLTVSKSGFVVAVVRPAPAAAGRHAAPARRRTAAEGHRVPAAARQRHRRPRARRRRRCRCRASMVRVMRYQYQQGERRLDAGRHGADRRPGAVPRLGPDARATTTSARSRATATSAGRRRRAAADRAARGGRGGRRAGGTVGGAGAADDAGSEVDYAPTYYPGRAVGERSAGRSPSASARKLLDINFGLLLVRTRASPAA